ncbi:DUF2808 domain-containing protein [Phormidium tenue FACHB-886]|nr:DUF2808 domain-containing protein [Phormidium tenue FACHB-886]
MSGNTVMVVFVAQNNPHWGDVYLFGVTAYPFNLSHSLIH